MEPKENALFKVSGGLIMGCESMTVHERKCPKVSVGKCMNRGVNDPRRVGCVCTEDDEAKQHTMVEVETHIENRPPNTNVLDNSEPNGCAGCAVPYQ